MKKEIQEIIDKGRIDSKKEYYILYDAGFLGNKPKTWNSLEEIIQSGWKEKVCIRGKRNVDFKSKYNLTLTQTKNYLEQLKRKGIYEDKLTFNQSLPDKFLTIQGEVIRTGSTFCMEYSTVKDPMKIALSKERIRIEDLDATWLLRKTLDPSSYDCIVELFDIFPKSIIEFSSYTVSVGELPHRNTIIWEVRNY